MPVISNFSVLVELEGVIVRPTEFVVEVMKLRVVWLALLEPLVSSNKLPQAFQPCVPPETLQQVPLEPVVERSVAVPELPEVFKVCVLLNVHTPETVGVPPTVPLKVGLGIVKEVGSVVLTDHVPLAT